MRQRWRFAFAAAAVVLLLNNAADGRALHVGGFDIDRGGAESFANADMSGLKRAIKQSFPGTDFTLKPAINSRLTSSVDVILLGVGTGPGSAIVPLSQKEQTALLRFVNDGGTLLLFADNDTFDPNASAANASLLSPFGAAVRGTLDQSQSVTLVGHANPLANGPFGTVKAISTFFPGWFSTLGDAKKLATLDGNGRPAIAFLRPGTSGAGSGAVVMFSDSSILVDATRSADTTTAILNALALTP